MLRSMCSMFVVGALALVIAGCDKAKPDYDKCLAADTAGDTRGAWKACEAAIAADPDSAAGKDATKMLAEIRQRLAAKEQAEADAKAKAAAEAQAQSYAAAAPERQRLLSSTDAKDWRTLVSKYPESPEAKAVQPKLDDADLDALIEKVKCKHERFCKDSRCVSHPKASVAKTCEGSSSRNIEKIALARGCVHAYDASGGPPSYTGKDSLDAIAEFSCYCCPAE